MSRLLTPREEHRIRTSIKQKLMHISPTISPAPKSIERNEIESIYEGLKYYADKGITNCVIQPKYMGSYCDIYLSKDIDQTKFFSRKGFDVSRIVDHDKLIEAVRPLWSKFNDRDAWDYVKLAIVQSELMPWSAIGKGLIEKDFESYGECHKDHLDNLSNSNLLSILNKEKESSEYKFYLEDKATLSEKELRNKYKNHCISQYEALSNISVPTLDKYKTALELYNQQLAIHGQVGDLHFKPFHILKAIYNDNFERLIDSHYDGFKGVSDDYCLSLNLSPDNFDESVTRAYKFFNELNDLNMEGIIIKPDQVWVKDIAPMLKVRNNNYLQMIYGLRFQDDYNYYLEKRRVGKKMNCSINEWKIAEAILKIPYDSISSENQEYTNLIRTRILEEDFEAQLDTRL